MGLFDALRGRGRGDEEPAAGLGTFLDEVVQLSPAPGSRYACDGSAITFGAGSVSEVDGDGVRRSGEYTPAGRFLLSASLEPSVVITLTSPVLPDTASFTARRTDIARRDTRELQYARLD